MSHGNESETLASTVIGGAIGIIQNMLHGYISWNGVIETVLYAFIGSIAAHFGSIAIRWFKKKWK